MVLLMAIRPERTASSWFQLKKNQDKHSIRREELLDDIRAIIRFYVYLSILLVTATSIVLWQWWGIAFALIAIIFGMLVASQKKLQSGMTRAYSQYESKFLNFVEKYAFVGKLLGSKRRIPKDKQLESTEQLVYMVESASEVLTPQQQTIIKRSITWHNTPVSEIMTSRESIVPIKQGELLGPLVLDDLHRSGFSRFPVIDGNLDTVVGILNTSDLLEIDSGRKSQVVEKIMSPQVLRIKSDDMLPSALKILQKSQLNILIVVDEEGRTMGILTLSDIAGSLLGK